MACEIKELEFENYGNCLSVSNGMIEAVVTIDAVSYTHLITWR